MGARRGFTRRDVLKAGGAGALALGAAGCATDDYEVETESDPDAPNVLMIVTDSTRADYIGAYNRRSIAKTPNLDALAGDSLRFSLAVPEAMPTGPVRRAVLTGQRGFPYRDWVLTAGAAGGAGLDADRRSPADLHGDARQRRDLHQLLHGQPVPRRAALRQLPPDARRRAARLLPGRLPRVQQALQAARAARRRSSATCCPTSPTPWRCSACATTWAGTPSFAGASVTTRRRASCAWACRCSTSQEKGKPFFLGVDSFDPHEPFDAPRAYNVQLSGSGQQGDPEGGHHPDPALRHAVEPHEHAARSTTRRSS